MGQERAMDVVMAWGGVAGAASAIALARVGARVRVYEAYEDPGGAVGSFLSLAANGLRGLEVLGVLDQVRAAGCSVPRQRMWSGRGKLLGDVPRGRIGDDPMISVTLMRAGVTSMHTLAPVPRWHDDRTVLIGDAAHPVGSGQGASMAIEDAIVLAQELGRAGSVAAALKGYDQRRRERVEKMARTAASNRDAKVAGPLTARLRDVVMPLMFNRFYPKATAWLYAYDPGQLAGVAG